MANLEDIKTQIEELNKRQIGYFNNNSGNNIMYSHTAS